MLTSAVLDFGGRHASFTCSTQLEADQPSTSMGTAGRLLVESRSTSRPDPARQRSCSAAVATAGSRRASRSSRSPRPTPYAVGDAFSAAVRDGTAVPIPPADAIGNMDVIDRIPAPAVRA